LNIWYLHIQDPKSYQISIEELKALRAAAKKSFNANRSNPLGDANPKARIRGPFLSLHVRPKLNTANCHAGPHISNYIKYY
jgi:hypothetical protein